MTGEAERSYDRLVRRRLTPPPVPPSSSGPTRTPPGPAAPTPTTKLAPTATRSARRPARPGAPSPSRESSEANPVTQISVGRGEFHGYTETTTSSTYPSADGIGDILQYIDTLASVDAADGTIDGPDLRADLLLPFSTGFSVAAQSPQREADDRSSPPTWSTTSNGPATPPCC